MAARKRCGTHRGNRCATSANASSSAQTQRTKPRSAVRRSDKPYLVKLAVNLRRPAREPQANPLRQIAMAAYTRRTRAAEGALTSAAGRAEKEMARLKRGRSVDFGQDGWAVALRPVKARSACISCHTRSRVGDTLGVMAYAVGSKVVE